MQQRLAYCRRAPTQHAVKIAEGELGLERGAGVDEIRDRFGLHQIELAIEHRAFGEFARLRKSRTAREDRGDDALDEQRTSVQRQFDEIVAGERVRRDVADGDALIERLSVQA